MSLKVDCPPLVSLLIPSVMALLSFALLFSDWGLCGSTWAVVIAVVNWRAGVDICAALRGGAIWGSIIGLLLVCVFYQFPRLSPAFVPLVPQGFELTLVQVLLAFPILCGSVQFSYQS